MINTLHYIIVGIFIGITMQIIMTLVFSSVLLVFMIYPAIKIVEFLEMKIRITDKMYNIKLHTKYYTQQ